jgi:hypothetical protein
MKNNRSSGFVVLIVIMISVMILVYLMAKQYQNLAERNHNVITAEEQAGLREQGSPIDRADAARDSIESRNKFYFGQ